MYPRVVVELYFGRRLLMTRFFAKFAVNREVSL